MATVGHLAVGAAIGRAFGAPGDDGLTTAKRMAIAACLATAADADLLLRFIGVRSNDSAYAHRGATHSLVAGAFVAAAAHGMGAGERDAVCYGTAALSHGLTDLLSSSEQGIALLWPATSRRYSSRWNPVPAVLTPEVLKAGRFTRALAREAMLFLPFVLFAIWPRRS